MVTRHHTGALAGIGGHGLEIWGRGFRIYDSGFEGLAVRIQSLGGSGWG